MRFMIRCDVEGVTGVTGSPLQADGTLSAYASDMFHHDLNAVVDGLLDAGDHEIWVYDMHGAGRNLNMARLNPCVRVVCGKPWYQPGNAGGLTAEFDGHLLIGMFSKVGSGELLSHTYDMVIRSMLLNGESVGVIGLEAAIAAELGVPTLMVSGDSAGCAEARAQLGDLVTVTVKDSLGPHAAVCYPASRTGELLRAGASAAAERAFTTKPQAMNAPVSLHLMLENGIQADHLRSRLNSFVQADGSLNIKADSIVAAWHYYLQARGAA